MSCMFYGCSSLNSLDLSTFNTNNVVNIYFIFTKCSSLSSVHLSIFNTSSIIWLRDVTCSVVLIKVNISDLYNYLS